MARAMKDSGVEWLGQIPADWETIKLKYLFSIIGGNGFPDALQGNEDGDYPFCKVSDINGAIDYVDTASNWVSQSIVDSNQFNIVPIGSIIMAKIGAALRKNHRKINMVECCIDNNTQALVPRRNDDLRYLLYLSKCIDMSWFDNNSTVPSINNPKLLNFFVPVPPLDEQSRIATFLDDECARIDSVIEKTRASIEEYKKLKQSIITRAVTKGIRPNRTLKDSGIEWLGQIPTDWTTPKLSLICSVITDYVASGSFASLAENVEYLDEPDYAMLVRTADISNKGYKPKPVYLNQHSYEFLSNSNLFGGELIFPNIGASVGDVYIVPVLYERMTLAPNAVMVKTNHVDKYYYYYFQSKPGRLSIEDIAQSTAQAKFNKTDFRQLRVLLPPDKEQHEIANYLDEKTAAIDSLIAKKNQLVTELESLKKSLIFEYVTGKKEVPT